MQCEWRQHDAGHNQGNVSHVGLPRWPHNSFTRLSRGLHCFQIPAVFHLKGDMSKHVQGLPVLEFPMLSQGVVEWYNTSYYQWLLECKKVNYLLAVNGFYFFSLYAEYTCNVKAEFSRKPIVLYDVCEGFDVDVYCYFMEY